MIRFREQIRWALALITACATLAALAPAASAQSSLAGPPPRC